MRELRLFRRTIPFAVKDKRTGLPTFLNLEIELVGIPRHAKPRKIVMDMFYKLILPAWKKGEKEVIL